jgi:uncharacterized Fe-S cluster-containing radical SAM superfamily enzyme
MTDLQYSNVKFVDFDEEKVKVIFKERYYFFLDKAMLIMRIGKFEISKEDSSIINFNAPLKRSQTRFDNFIDIGLGNLFNSNKNKKTIYIYEGLVPLIGTNEFGIVDRNTSTLEVKPLTGCNLNCVFCSVSEGVNAKIDYLVEPDYLVEEIKKVVELKESEFIEINIGPQGEPLLYPDLVYFIQELKKIKKINIVSMNSNGRILTKELLDDLINAGLDRINLSVHSMNEDKQKELSGSAMPITRLKELIKYSSNRIEIFLAPLYIPKLNEDIEPLIEFAKSYKKGPRLIGIQNFLNYSGGRNPVKQISFDKFYDMLRSLEKKHNVKLKLSFRDYSIKEDNILVKPFKKGKVVDAIIKIPGRRDNEAIAVAQNRAITVYDCKFEKDKKIRVKLTRDKHNIFSGTKI